jgi:multiple sugar transport system substrate-binding protein
VQQRGGPASLTWYINPGDAPGQREQLVRRLAAGDTSIDIMSLDPPFIPEFAEAGFLAPVPEDVAEETTEGVVDSALAGAMWREKLVTVPFWANTQLLWYRTSVAEEAGLDMEEPVTWEQLIEAAEATETTIAVQGTRAESLTVWINALIESAGGTILENPEAEADQLELGIDSEAGTAAAQVIADVVDAGVGGPALSTSTEDSGATLFEGDSAGFMVNYPFVWPRALGAVEEGTLEQDVVDDYGWTVYPAVAEGEEARPPYGGINIGVSAVSESVDDSYEAVRCIVSEENQKEYMISDGNPASKAAVFEDPEVQEAFPMAETIRESLEVAAPRPQTPYYNEISSGLQRTWHPPESIDPERTPAEAEELITAVLRGDDLL